MRLINGNHLEERVRKIVKDYAQAAKDSNITPGRVTFSSCGVIGLVESEPIVDAVPVIRCGKCNFWDKDHISCEGLAKCCTGEGGIRYRNRSDFCSRGARMDGDSHD